MARLSFFVALSLIAAPSPALAQAGRLGGGGGGVDVSLTRVISALVLCLMLAALAILLLKRNGGKVDLPRLSGLFARVPVAARRIDVIETRRVSQHAEICLLRCDGRDYLILCSAQQQQVLRDAPVAELTVPEETVPEDRE